MATMKGKRILTSLYIEPEVHRALKRLSEETRVPIAVYLREAVSDLLAKYKVTAVGGRFRK
jgi:predicted DNA-binding protein